ncbi:uncharacterized protein LOC124357333 [Homalodisca vitripennis]|nr:uncharacterized protein LOC124357333 [Homalodisca vitripennis]
MYATVRICALLSAVAVAVATPYYLPQQRQLFYSVLPQYPQYTPVAAPAPVNYRQFYYAPQTAANLVAPVPSSLRYPAPVVAPSKQVVYYPGANPYLGNYVLAGDEANEGSGSWTSWLSNIPFASFITGQQPAAPESPAAEGGSAAEGASPAASAEKVELPSNNEKPEAETEDKPSEPAKTKGAPQKYVLLGQPQFFGNYGLHKLNPAAVIPSPEHGAVSSYLLLKNFPGVRFAPQVPQFPQVHQVPQQDSDAELVPAVQPGAAALDYQKLLQAARQQKDYDDASVTVDAAQKDATPADDKPAAAADDDKESEDEETGTKE